MSAIDHPITLEKLVFLKSVVESIPEHEPAEYEPGKNKVSAPPENHLNVSKMPDEERTYSVTMKTVVNPGKDKSSPYSVEMDCIAVFHVDESLTEDEALRAALITGHNVLYGAIRESVAWLTGRQVYGPLLLGLSVLKPPPKPPAAP
jgi:preprotein translocase subunit SecB